MKMIEDLGNSEQVVAYKAYQGLLVAVTRAGAPGNESERAKWAELLAQELNATNPGGKDDKGKEKPPLIKHSARIRNQVARLLSYVGGENEIEALVKALDDLEVREMARFALDRNTAYGATKALVAALDRIGPRFRIGVINALAKKNGHDSVQAIRAMTADGDAEVRIAAIEALATMADPDGDQFIAKATTTGSAQDRIRAHKARVRLAEALRKSGDHTVSAGVYRAIHDSDAPAAQKKAAEIGLKALA
jgi:HEAT repeat protein